MKEVDVYYLVELIGATAYKWKEICGQCGLLPSEIEAIRREPVNITGGHAHCLAVGLAQWCNIHRFDHKLSVLVKALRSRIVNEGVLAGKVLHNCSNLPSVKQKGDFNTQNMATSHF